MREPCRRHAHWLPDLNIHYYSLFSSIFFSSILKAELKPSTMLKATTATNHIKSDGLAIDIE